MNDLKWKISSKIANKSFLDDFHPESQVRVWLEPRKYLQYCERVSYGVGKGRIDPNKLAEAKYSLEQGVILEPPHLDVATETGKILVEEGRLNVIAAEELGNEMIPVVIFVKYEKGGFADVTKDRVIAKEFTARFGVAVKGSGLQDYDGRLL